MSGYHDEGVDWNCDECGGSLDENSYVTKVTTVTAQVLKAEDGRVIDIEPQFAPETEHLCYTCYQKKYKEPREALRTCMTVIANIIELIEDDTGGLAFSNPEALEKLNKLVVYIAEQLKDNQDEQRRT